MPSQHILFITVSHVYIFFIRPVEYMRGFTREVVTEVTANIESQEMRRLQNGDIGYPEHPRAGSTEDLECFFGVAHTKLGSVFTLKEFKDGWPKLVRYTRLQDKCKKKRN